MRLTLRFDVFLVSHSPTPTQNFFKRSDSLSIGKLVCVEELKSVDVIASFRMDGGRRQPRQTRLATASDISGTCSPRRKGFLSKTVAAGRRGAPSARLTSRPEPLALRMSWYGSRAPPHAISGLGVSVKFRVMWSGLT